MLKLAIPRRAASVSTVVSTGVAPNSVAGVPAAFL